MNWHSKPGRPRRADLLAHRVVTEALNGWTPPAPILGRIADVLHDEFLERDRARNAERMRIARSSEAEKSA